MSQRREAMLELICIATGLEPAEVKIHPALRGLLDHADAFKGKTRKYRQGILTFWWPRRGKDGTVLPFLGISVDSSRMERDEVRFRTFDLRPEDMDLEFGLTDAEVERFAKARARKAEALRSARGVVGKRTFRLRPSVALTP